MVTMTSPMASSLRAVSSRESVSPARAQHVKSLVRETGTCAIWQMPPLLCDRTVDAMATFHNNLLSSRMPNQSLYPNGRMGDAVFDG